MSDLKTILAAMIANENKHHITKIPHGVCYANKLELVKQGLIEPAWCFMQRGPSSLNSPSTYLIGTLARGAKPEHPDGASAAYAWVAIGFHVTGKGLAFVNADNVEPVKDNPFLKLLHSAPPVPGLHIGVGDVADILARAAFGGLTREEAASVANDIQCGFSKERLEEVTNLLADVLSELGWTVERRK